MDFVKYNKSSAKGIGMNRVELQKNAVFRTSDDYLVQDLNVNPVIDAEFAPNESFYIVTIAVSIDYLVNPREVIQEILRMLKPEGLLILSFSNRMFWTKAFKIWTQSAEDKRVYIASSFLHYFLDDDESQEAGLRFEYVDAFRIDDQSQSGDPMYVVMGRKKSAECKSNGSSTSCSSKL